jgi:hypothetical protein
MPPSAEPAVKMPILAKPLIQMVGESSSIKGDKFRDLAENIPILCWVAGNPMVETKSFYLLSL